MSHPVLTRFRLGVAAAVVAGLCVACLSPSQQGVLDAVNRDRRAHGVPAVAGDAAYSRRAQAHAENMAARGGLYHSDLGTALGPGICAVGENVGVGTSVAAVQQAFMASRTHRAITLTARYDHAGVGAVWKGGRMWVVVVYADRC